MVLTKEDIIKILEDKKIKYEIVEHKAVFTIDEMLECNLPHPEQIAKNLFIRDDKKNNDHNPGISHSLDGYGPDA